MSTDRVSDAELVGRARHGDAAAFGELVDRHRNAVYRATLAALGSPADAEDAAQDAFLAAYRRLASFRGESSFKTWLLTIAWHQAINHRRRLTAWWRVVGRPSREPEPGEPEREVPSSDASPEEAAFERQLRDGIRSAILALPPRLKDTFLLAQSGEYTYEEIGSMLGAPLGTIKWRISEARRMLRTTLSERGFGDIVCR